MHMDDHYDAILPRNSQPDTSSQLDTQADSSCKNTEVPRYGTDSAAELQSKMESQRNCIWTCPFHDAQAEVVDSKPFDIDGTNFYHINCKPKIGLRNKEMVECLK